jgi:hypothetical protein
MADDPSIRAMVTEMPALSAGVAGPSVVAASGWPGTGCALGVAFSPRLRNGPGGQITSATDTAVAIDPTAVQKVPHLLSTRALSAAPDQQCQRYLQLIPSILA